MEMFLSTFINKVDKKGRVSVPAQFRQVLKDSSFNGIIIYSSFINPCIEACSIERMIQLTKSIELLEVFSEVRDALSMTLLGESLQLGFDTEGRVLLPEKLIHTTNIKDNAAFVGKGPTFEIWPPEELEFYAQNARKIAKEHRGIIKFN